MPAKKRSASAPAQQASPATPAVEAQHLAPLRGWQDAGPLALLLLFSVALLWPALRSGSGWGLYDWDQHLFYYAAPRRSLLEFGQFPFWNPWYCGGIPGFANPQSPVFSLSFLLTLAFGEPFGLKLSAAVHAAIGMWGGYVLAREHGIDRISSMLGGLLLMGSTVYTLHVAVGHTIWLPTAYFPWALWAYMRSRADLRWSLLTGVCLVGMTLHGQLYLVVYTALVLGAWSVVDAAARRDWRPLAAVALAGVALGLLAAFKLLPMQEIFAGRSYQLEDKSSSSLDLIVAALMRRDQALLPAERLAGQQWDWWEYGAYVGPVPIALGLLGAWSRRHGMLTAAGLAVLFLWVSAGWDAGLWPIVQRLPLGAGVRVPSRMILVTVFFLGLLAASGLSGLRSRLEASGRGRLALALPLGLVLLVAGDLCAVSARPLTEAFEDVREPILETPGLYEQVLGAQRYANRTPYATMYPYLLENRGVVNCFERFALPPRATPRTRKDGTPIAEYRGEAFLLGDGTAGIAEFTPNRVEVSYDAPRGGLLVLNQNYHSGWSAGDVAAVDFHGLTSARVEPGSGRVVFWYRTRRLYLGVLISAAAWLGLLAASVSWLRRGRSASASGAASRG